MSAITKSISVDVEVAPADVPISLAAAAFASWNALEQADFFRMVCANARGWNANPGLQWLRIGEELAKFGFAVDADASDARSMIEHLAEGLKP